MIMNRYQINEIVKSTFRKILNEAFKPGESISIGVNDEMLGRRIIRQRYNADPEDFEYIGNGKFVYKAKKRSSSTRKKAPKKEKVFLGRKEGETEQDYLERVRQLNKKFADIENEIPGEEWRPVVNTGRYRSGNTDYTTSHEVSNMGRLRTVDYEDPMRSRISTGYDAPTRKARQFHLDAKTADGEWEKTTPPVHTMVADAWLDAPEGNIEDYDVEHIDGNYHNNRADNLRYVLRKGRRGRKAVPESIRRLTESDLHRIVKESVIRVLNEKLVYRNAKFYTPTPIPSNGGPMYNDTFAFKEFQKLIDGCNRQLKLPVLNRKQGIDASEFLIQQFENWVNEYGKYIVSNQPIGKLIKGSGIQNKFGEIEYVKGDGGYARIFADCVNSGTPYYDEAAETFDPYPDEEAYF